MITIWNGKRLFHSVLFPYENMFHIFVQCNFSFCILPIFVKKIPKTVNAQKLLHYQQATSKTAETFIFYLKAYYFKRIKKTVLLKGSNQSERNLFETGRVRRKCLLSSEVLSTVNKMKELICVRVMQKVSHDESVQNAKFYCIFVSEKTSLTSFIIIALLLFYWWQAPFRREVEKQNTVYSLRIQINIYARTLECTCLFVHVGSYFWKVIIFLGSYLTWSSDDLESIEFKIYRKQKFRKLFLHVYTCYMYNYTPYERSYTTEVNYDYTMEE